MRSRRTGRFEAGEQQCLCVAAPRLPAPDPGLSTHLPETLLHASGSIGLFFDGLLISALNNSLKSKYAFTLQLMITTVYHFSFIDTPPPVR
jgi:hypothetical protein